MSDDAKIINSTTGNLVTVASGLTETSPGVWVVNAAGGGPPSGAAGGVLAGTYPNPTLATDRIEKSTATAANKGLYSTAASTWAEFSLTALWRAFLGTTKAAWDETLGKLSITTATNTALLLTSTDGAGELVAKLRTSAANTTAAQAGFDVGFSDSDRMTLAIAGTAVGAPYGGSGYWFTQNRAMRFIQLNATDAIEFFLGAVRAVSIYGTTTRIGGVVSTSAAVTAVKAYVAPSTNTGSAQLGLGDSTGYSWQFGRENVTTGDLIIQTVSPTNVVAFTDTIRALAASGVVKFGQGVQVADLTAGLPVRATTSGRLTTATGPIYNRLATKTVADSPYSPITIDGTVLCNAVGGAMTVNLPAAASNTDRILRFKKIDSSANTVTVDGNASETIDGALTLVLSVQYAHVAIQSDGSNWWIVG